jgi:NAD(P)-dependent dehydrogenase (short-subunit alcohol dehydrogenase family)
MNFKNKICVITGGANGIGLCLVDYGWKKES